MKIGNALILMVLVSVATAAYGADNRGLCEKYYHNYTLDSCVTWQEAAEKRIESGVYSKNVVESCIQTAKRVDRIAVYYDFVAADTCAKKEQRRLDEQEALRAEAARDRAAADYLQEKTERERWLRRHPERRRSIRHYEGRSIGHQERQITRHQTSRTPTVVEIDE